MPDQFYNDLAWGGLDQTKAFLSLPLVDQERVINTIKAEQFGIFKNNITRKGNYAGCN